MVDQRIGFIGSGQMARALASAWVRAKLVRPDWIVIHDPISAAGERFLADVPGAIAVSDNRKLVASVDCVLVAVKPQNIAGVFDELRGMVTADKLVVSIVAGVSLSALQQHLQSDRVIRVMPNTPCLVGRGAAGYAMHAGASEIDRKLVEQLFGAVGVVFGLDEQLLDAVTGLSGSGPAYIFTIIEAMSDGGVRMGLPRSIATALAAQTVLGAAAMVLECGEHPAVLKERVASPGGTTIAGLQALEFHGVRGAMIDAVEAATRRSAELGKVND